MESTIEAVLPKPKYIVEKKKHGRGFSLRIDGQKLISPSRALGVVINKPALVNWAAKEAVANVRGAILDRLKGKDVARLKVTEKWVEEIMAEGVKRPEALKIEGGRVGTLLHKAFEDITLGKSAHEIVALLSKKDTPLKASIEGFEEWFLKAKLKIVGREMAVGSLKHGFGGILDSLAYGFDGFWIIDYKTGSGVYWESALQTMNYKLSVEEQYGIKIKGIRIVRVAKKEPFGVEVIPVSDLDNTERAWMKAFELFECSQGSFLGKPTYSTFFDIQSQKMAGAARSTAEQHVKDGNAPF